MPRSIGTSSFIIDARVKAVHGDEVFAEGSTRLVRLDHQTFKPCSWSATFREAVAPLLRDRPGAGAE